MEEIISTKDPKAIKGKRSTLLRMITTIRNNLAKRLEKTAGSFDHNKILRTRVLIDLTNLKKHQESFDVIHEGYLRYREEG